MSRAQASLRHFDIDVVVQYMQTARINIYCIVLQNAIVCRIRTAMGTLKHAHKNMFYTLVKENPREPPLCEIGQNDTKRSAKLYVDKITWVKLSNSYRHYYRKCPCIFPLLRFI